MPLQHLAKEQRRTTRWAKGDTTELYTYPPGSSLTQLNFDLRLSLATVEAEHSTFSPLPGVDRTLMVLEGELHLQHQTKEHEVQAEVRLQPLQQTQFSGDLITESRGKVINFNMMTRGINANVNAYQIQAGNQQQLRMSSSHGLYYLHSGHGTLNARSMDCADSILAVDEQTLTFTANTDSILIEALFVVRD